MVSVTDQQTLIGSKIEDIPTKPSFKRWLKHCFYFKTSRGLFNHLESEQIAQAVAEAEDGHRGEIQVIIEASLPSDCAYHYDTLQRARYLFGKYGVWDTERNSGLLVYINLCERQIELVADRGINQAVSQDNWEKICDDMSAAFKEHKFTEGLCVGILALGDLLQQFYADDHYDRDGNELSNLPRLL